MIVAIGRKDEKGDTGVELVDDVKEIFTQGHILRFRVGDLREVNRDNCVGWTVFYPNGKIYGCWHSADDNTI